MAVFYHDLRYVLRQASRQPGATAIAVLTLALAVGANTAIFSFVNALLIRPFPFHDPEQLAEIYSVRGGQRGSMSMREVLDVKEQVDIIEAIAAHTGVAGGYNYSGSGKPAEWRADLITGNLFEVLGVPLAEGRPWPDTSDRNRDYRVILSHAVREASFAGTSAVGQSISLDHAPGYRIDGVAMEGFDFPARVEVYRSIGGYTSYDRRESRNVTAIARIRRPFTVQRLQQELDAVSVRLANSFPESNRGLSFRAIPIRDVYSAAARPYLWILLAAVGAALAGACANVASLLLSRAIAREKEIAVRIALGAGRSGILRLLLAESAVISAAASAIGVALAVWWMAAIRNLVGAQLPQWLRIDLDWRVLAFAVAISVLTALACGLFPALQLAKDVHHDILKDGSRGTTLGRRARFAKNAIVGIQIALSSMLLSATGSIVHGLLTLQSSDKGFDSGGIATFRVALGWKRYTDQKTIGGYYERALESLRHAPGVTEAALVTNPPLARQATASPGSVQLEGQSNDEALRNPYVNRQNVSESYFELLGIPIVAGRAFNSFDRENGASVAIVSERLARVLWPGEQALGKRLAYRSGSGTSVLRMVVGIAGDVQHDELGGQAGLDLYIPYRQEAAANQYLLARTALPLNQFRSVAEEALWSIDSEQSLFDFASYDQRIENSIWQLRLSRLLLLLLSAMSLALAAVGIYGAISFSVAQQKREIGIRLALGATPGRTAVQVIRGAALLALAGCAGGFAGAVLLQSVLAAWLPAGADFSEWIPPITALMAFVVAVGASAQPAWKAFRIAPDTLMRDV
jgi:putative ABC transport system permease protein